MPHATFPLQILNFSCIICAIPYRVLTRRNPIAIMNNELTFKLAFPHPLFYLPGIISISYGITSQISYLHPQFLISGCIVGRTPTQTKYEREQTILQLLYETHSGVLVVRSPKEKSLIAAFHDFSGVNTPTLTNFKLLTHS